MLSQFQTTYIHSDESKLTNTIKLTIAGDGGVGKTSLCSSFTTGRISTSYNMTIGADIFSLPIESPVDGRQTKLLVFDLAGQDRFDCVRDLFYKGTKVAIIVFSLANRGSFYDLSTWIRELQREVPGIPFIIVGNKKDLSREVSLEEAKMIAEKFGAPYFESSASKNENVKEIFHTATLLAMRNSVCAF
ncbi:MAG: GTP-binding protein [Promethearchaeota archaeon]